MDDFNCSVKRTPDMKQWIAQADLPREASTLERMDGQSKFFCSNKITH